MESTETSQKVECGAQSWLTEIRKDIPGRVQGVHAISAGGGRTKGKNGMAVLSPKGC